jgi:hypothetical protein
MPGRITLLLLVICSFLPVFPAGHIVGEYQLKAAFLYKFASFVEWPPQRGTSPVRVPVCIGVIGEDPFGPVLDEAVKNQTVNGRDFLVRRFTSGQNPGECQIVYISPSEKKRIRSILDRLQGAPVLTVGDFPEFCRAGGIINLAIEDQRVRLEVNLDAAARAQLKISSKLLSVARIAHGGAP